MSELERLEVALALHALHEPKHHLEAASRSATPRRGRSTTPQPGEWVTKWTSVHSEVPGEWQHQGPTVDRLRKTQLCRFYYEHLMCKRPTLCTFAHHLSELSPPPVGLDAAGSDYPKAYVGEDLTTLTPLFKIAWAKDVSGALGGRPIPKELYMAVHKAKPPAPPPGQPKPSSPRLPPPPADAQGAAEPKAPVPRDELPYHYFPVQARGRTPPRLPPRVATPTRARAAAPGPGPGPMPKPGSMPKQDSTPPMATGPAPVEPKGAAAAPPTPPGATDPAQLEAAAAAPATPPGATDPAPAEPEVAAAAPPTPPGATDPAPAEPKAATATPPPPEAPEPAQAVSKAVAAPGQGPVPPPSDTPSVADLRGGA